MPGPTRAQVAASENLKRIDPQVEVRWDERTGAVLRVRGALSTPTQGVPEEISRQFLEGQKTLLGLEAPAEELRLKRVETDQRGNRHICYQQLFRGVPVFGAELIVHVTAENAVRGFGGNVVPNLDIQVQSRVSAADAVKAVLQHDRENKARAADDPLLVILVREAKPHLVWMTRVDGTDKTLSGSPLEAIWVYFVDAGTGQVVFRYNDIKTHTATTGTGTGRYAGVVGLNTVHNHTTGKWELEDRWMPTAAHIGTHDADGGFPPKPLSADDDNNWSAADQGPEVDCHAFTRMVFDYFLMVHGRNSFDNAGADMNIYAHCGSSWNNASWNGSEVKIGDGDGIAFGPFSTLDIVAHEWVHGVTEHTANLVYFDESGALNESMSDVFAALIDGDWLQGEDNWLNTASAPAGRNLADPTNGGQYKPADPITSVLAGHQPDHTNDQYTGTADNGGVHINSGIMNKAAYLIATGGTHRGIRICEGLGREILGRLYYHALTSHLTQNSTFADMRDAALDSLDDLYLGDPRYSRWKASVNNAFAAVGVGTAVLCPKVCYVAPVRVCPVGPIVHCPPAPIVHCPTGPIYVCQPAPVATCAPGPIATCPPAPVPPGGGCLPGPDPGPFRPRVGTPK